MAVRSETKPQEEPGLGRLAAFCASARPLQAAVEAYVALGLRDVPVGDFVPGPRAVVSDGRFSIGLDDGELEGPVPMFVRPNLRRHVRDLEAAGVEFELVELADDQFHRALFRDPSSDCSLMLVEARPFPPVEQDPRTVFACGEFVELSVATRSLEASLRFWSSLGFTPLDADEASDRTRRLEGNGLVVGLHETSRFSAGLTFRAPQLDARIEYLRAKGFELRRDAPFSAVSLAATLFPPGLRFFLLGVEEPEGYEA